MRVVHKYPFPIEDHFRLELPLGAKVLSVQVQRGQPCLWALVTPSTPLGERFFRLAGTGHEITQEPSRLKHVGTFQLHDGAIVFHLFEVLP